MIWGQKVTSLFIVCTYFDHLETNWKMNKKQEFNAAFSLKSPLNWHQNKNASTRSIQARPDVEGLRVLQDYYGCKA